MQVRQKTLPLPRELFLRRAMETILLVGLTKSGKGHDGIPNSSGTAQSWESSSLNSKPTVSFTGTNSNMKIKDSETKFDGWSKLHVFAVFQINGNPNWSRVLERPQMQVRETTQLGTTQLVEVIMILHCTLPLQPIPPVRIIGDRKTTATRLHSKITLAYFSLSYDGANFITRIDGSQIDTVSVTGPLQSLSSEPVRLGQNFSMKMSEFLIFHDKLSSTNEQILEGYLAHKWEFRASCPVLIITNQAPRILEVGQSREAPVEQMTLL